MIYFALHHSKPVPSTAVGMDLLGIPIIQRDAKVHSIPTPLPCMRQVPAYRPGQQAAFRPAFVTKLQRYEGRPQGLEDIPFCTYFREYIFTKKLRKQGTLGFANIAQPRDNFDFYVYKLEPGLRRICRFSDPDPNTDPEAFFYSYLLRHKPFSHEGDLLTEPNTNRSYAYQCYLDGYITSRDGFFNILEEFSTRQLLSEQKHHTLMHEAMGSDFGEFLGSPDGEDPYGDADQTALQNATNAAAAVAALNPTADTSLTAELSPHVAHKTLTTQQQAVFAAVTAMPSGNVAITGVPGAGKTLLAMKFAVHYEAAGKRVDVSALTGAAATRISRKARTTHGTFGLPVSGQLNTLTPASRAYHAILATDVFIIDEFSMLSGLQYAMIMHQIRHVVQSAGGDTTSAKLLIFLGDAAQLPPICIHTRKPRRATLAAAAEDSDSGTEADPPAIQPFCYECHIASNEHWQQHVVKFHLPHSMRHDSDTEYMAFLNHIRRHQPTQAMLDDILNTPDSIMSDPDAIVAYTAPSATHLEEDECTVICTNRTPAAQYNASMLQQRFTPDQIFACDIVHDVPLATVPLQSEQKMRRWVYKKHFHTLPQLAVGALVRVTANLNLKKGASNGAIGTVLGFRRAGPHDDIVEIRVRLHNGDVTNVSRSKRDTTMDGARTHCKKTFPLMLAYAITGHSSQGATIRGKVLIDVTAAFAHGQLYVMLSRVLRRSQIKLRRPLLAEHVIPVPQEILDMC